MPQEIIPALMLKPSERIDEIDENGFNVTYHWVDQGNKHTFLYLTFSKKQLSDGSVYLVQSNIDSSEVKGQGDRLWYFMTKKIEQISQFGIGDKKALPIIHEVNPNQHSLRLAENDSRYTNRNGVFWGLYKS